MSSANPSKQYGSATTQATQVCERLTRRLKYINRVAATALSGSGLHSKIKPDVLDSFSRRSIPIQFYPVVSMSFTNCVNESL